MCKIPYNNEGKYLFKTSSTLFIPCIYGIINNNYQLTIMNLISSIISGNFWYNPKLGIARTLDLCFQPLFGIYMYCNGMSRLYNNIIPISIANLFLMNGLYMYYKSWNEYKKVNRFWFVYHGGFHILMTSACFCVHYSAN